MRAVWEASEVERKQGCIDGWFTADAMNERFGKGSVVVYDQIRSMTVWITGQARYR